MSGVYFKFHPQTIKTINVKADLPSSHLFLFACSVIVWMVDLTTEYNNKKTSCLKQIARFLGKGGVGVQDILHMSDNGKIKCRRKLEKSEECHSAETQ